MASRVLGRWRAMLGRMGGTNRSVATASATASDFAHHPNQTVKPLHMRGEFVPVYVVLGLIVVAVSIGAHTAKQHLVHSPGVYVSKKKRESVPEVDDPDRVADEADKFVTKSFLRKVAHIQDFDAVRAGLSDPTRADPFAHPRTVESLKSVGLDPQTH